MIARKVLGLIAWYDGLEAVDVFRIETPRAFEALPPDGVIEMAVYFDDGRRNMLGGHDFYFYAPHRDGQIYGSESYTTEDEIKRRYPGAIVKRGKWVPEETMARVAELALAAKWGR